MVYFFIVPYLNSRPPVLFYSNPTLKFYPHLTAPRSAQTGREPFIPIYGDKFATLVRFLSRSFATFVKEKVAWRDTPIIFYCTIDLLRILYGLRQKRDCLSICRKWIERNLQVLWTKCATLPPFGNFNLFLLIANAGNFWVILRWSMGI